MEKAELSRGRYGNSNSAGATQPKKMNSSVLVYWVWHVGGMAFWYIRFFFISLISVSPPQGWWCCHGLVYEAGGKWCICLFSFSYISWVSWRWGYQGEAGRMGLGLGLVAEERCPFLQLHTDTCGHFHWPAQLTGCAWPEGWASQAGTEGVPNWRAWEELIAFEMNNVIIFKMPLFLPNLLLLPILERWICQTWVPVWTRGESSAWNLNRLSQMKLHRKSWNHNTAPTLSSLLLLLLDIWMRGMGSPRNS